MGIATGSSPSLALAWGLNYGPGHSRVIGMAAIRRPVSRSLRELECSLKSGVNWPTMALSGTADRVE